ncbi:hypothetical protein CDAR_58341 [Caerostris darwini]|uniref:Uncharacterized protein n=1 Tax=Caerostris darwini TaxID=1538125 RepID=A0AAV4U717_9ARAC|nr:hypothetical protein CDAR_58341 [Caerostris darwini]
MRYHLLRYRRKVILGIYTALGGRQEAVIRIEVQDGQKGQKRRDEGYKQGAHLDPNFTSLSIIHEIISAVKSSARPNEFSVAHLRPWRENDDKGKPAASENRSVLKTLWWF